MRAFVLVVLAFVFSTALGQDASAAFQPRELGTIHGCNALEVMTPPYAQLEWRDIPTSDRPIAMLVGITEADGVRREINVAYAVDGIVTAVSSRGFTTEVTGYSDTAVIVSILPSLQEMLGISDADQAYYEEGSMIPTPTIRTGAVIIDCAGGWSFDQFGSFLNGPID